VIAVSDQQSAFELTQHAFNLAEEYQIPVIILSEKVVAESSRMVPNFTQNTIQIKRNLVTDSKELAQLDSSDRYKITDSGVSKRRLPGTSETIFFCNGDEHHEDGTLDESPGAADMIAKRIRKKDAILAALPEPIIYGNTTATYSFIGRGSTKDAILDLIHQGEDINYLHFEYVYPLQTNILKQFIEQNTHVCIAENNAT
jgi:2-oxoglutarate ferredoxin oxidoreductase subunit alpha